MTEEVVNFGYTDENSIDHEHISKYYSRMGEEINRNEYEKLLNT